MKSKFKKIVEDNPVKTILTLIVSLIIGTGAITSSILIYIFNQKLEIREDKLLNRIDELESTLGSIKRGLLSEDYINFSKFLITPSEPLNLNAKSKFYAADNFYALSDDENWEYHQTTTDSLFSLLTNTPFEVNKGQEISHINLWKGKKDLVIEGKFGLKRLFSYITLSKYSVKKLGESFSRSFEGYYSKNNFSFEGKFVDQNLMDQLKKVFENDKIGSLFFGQINKKIRESITYSDMNFKIIKLQKINDILYGSILINLKNVKLHNVKKSEYYISEEVIMFLTSKDIYFVNISIPSEEPMQRVESYSAVTEWLSCFKIVNN